MKVSFFATCKRIPFRSTEKFFCYMQSDATRCQLRRRVSRCEGVMKGQTSRHLANYRNAHDLSQEINEEAIVLMGNCGCGKEQENHVLYKSL